MKKLSKALGLYSAVASGALVIGTIATSTITYHVHETAPLASASTHTKLPFLLKEGSKKSSNHNGSSSSKDSGKGSHDVDHKSRHDKDRSDGSKDSRNGSHDKGPHADRDADKDLKKTTGDLPEVPWAAGIPVIALGPVLYWVIRRSRSAT